MDFVCAIEVDATEQTIIKAANNCILFPIEFEASNARFLGRVYPE